MKKNMGSADRTLRIIVVIIIAILYFTGTVSGTVALVLGIAAIAFLLTSMVGFCPLYVPLGISTCKKEK